MNKKNELIVQIKKVIGKLETEYRDEITDGIIKLIYNRYKDALDILENNKELSKINIIGGVKAYMDSYNDYNNPLLGEMYKAEKILKEIL